MLQDLRYKHGLSLSQLSRQVGYSITYLNNLELGHRPGSIKLLKRLSEFYDCNFEELCDAQAEEYRVTGRVYD